MAARGKKSVPIKGLTDKRNITLTFVVSLNFCLCKSYVVEKPQHRSHMAFNFQRDFVSLKIPSTGEMNRKL